MLTRVLNIASCCVLTRVLFCVSMQQIYTSKRCVNTCFFTRLFAGKDQLPLIRLSHTTELKNNGILKFNDLLTTRNILIIYNFIQEIII